MTKKKQQQNGRGRDDALGSALASLQDAQAQAREAFDEAFERLESKASSRLSQIADGSADDATAVTVAMRDVLALTEAASSDALGEMKSSRQELRNRLARVFEETEGLRASVEEARATTEATVIEFDARGKAQLEEMVAWRDQELGRLLADTTDRVSALSSHLEEQTATVDDDVNRLRTRTTQELESILSDTARHRASVEEARATTEATVIEFDARGKAQLEEMVAWRDQELGRLLADTTDRVSALSSHLEEQTATVDDDVNRLRTRTTQELESILSDTARHRASVEEARATTEATVIEFDARGKAQLEEMVAWRDQELGRLLADTTDRVSALSSHLEEQTATVDDDVNRLRTRTTQELESILSDTARHRASVEEACSASAAAAAAGIAEACSASAAAAAVGIADADRRSQEHADEFDGKITELSGQAETRLTEAAQHFEGQVRARGQAVERIVAETAERLTGSQRALDQSGQQIREQAAQHLAELLVAVDRDAQELQTIACTRMEAALEAVDQQSVATLGRAAERAAELLAETEDHEHLVEAQRARCASLADAMVEHAQHAAASVVEAGEALQLIRSHAVIAETFMTRLSDEVERARQLVGALQDEAVDDHEMSGADEAGPNGGADPEPAWPDDLAEADAAISVDESPPDEAASDDKWRSGEPGDEVLDDAALYEDDFFSRVASEFVTEVGSGYPSGDEREQSTPVPVSAAMPYSPLGASALETRDYQAGTALATLPVSVLVSVASLKASFRELEEGIAGSLVRLEVHHAESGMPDGSCTLRLVTYDPAGWWEYGDVSVTSDGTSAPWAVVAVAELHDALQAIDRFAGGEATRILFDEGVTIGNHLLLVQDDGGVPAFPQDRQLVERVHLSASDRSGAVLETQVGRLFVPPQLLTHLRRRHTTTTDLVMVDGVPCLSARLGDSPVTPGLTIVAPLKELGKHDDPMLHERRDKPGNEVAQLVAALSATSTSEELARILKVGVGYARRKAAAHPALQPELIHDLICEGTEVMRAAAAANPSISADDADRATADTSPVVRAAVAANASLSPQGLTELAADAVASVRAQVASNAVASQELLERLAEDPDAFVRGVVAAQQNLPLETLLVLARDPELMVCAAVAGNPICPAEVLRDLISLVPDAVLANPNAPRNLLVAGSVVDASRLRVTVAGNPATPAKGLRNLARDTDPDVLRAVAVHPGAPSNVRRRARRKLEAPPGEG